MDCPACGRENPAGMNFCGGCAAQLTRSCPSCGFENPPGFAFCGKCAAGLEADATQPEPTAREPAT
jgi:adenylate cyclase